MIKTLHKLSIERNSLNLIEIIYKQPTANILSGEKLKTFPLRSGTEQGMPHLITPFNIVEILANSIRQEKEIKDNTNWEGKPNCLCLQMT